MGNCIDCKSEDITYTDTEITDSQVGYAYYCEDCKNSGTEWYGLHYIETVSSRED